MCVFQQSLIFIGTGGAAVALSAGVYAVAVAGLAGFASVLFVAITFLAPRPGMYFGWIGGLITVVTLVLPFTTDAALSSQAILAVINAIIGAVIIMLIPLAAVLRRRPTI